MATDSKTAPTLNLDALTERTIVAIDGTRYELRQRDELPPLDGYRLKKLGKRLLELVAADDLTDDQQEDLKTLPRTVCGMVLMAPPEVLAALSDEQCWAVCQVFFQQAETWIGAIVQAMVPAKTPPTESPTGA